MDALVNPTCPNCGHAIDDPFCPQCGQHQVHLHPTMRELLKDFADEVFHVESRATLTLKKLVTEPGQLTLDYFEGKRARYVGPVRLYLAMSLLYFFLFAATGGGLNSTAQAHLAVNVTTTNPEEVSKLSASLAKKPAWVKLVIGPILEAGQSSKSMEEFQQKQVHALTNFLPKAMFFLIPLFALLTRALFRGQHYAAHFVFALHFHAFAFLNYALKTLSPVFWTDWLFAIWGAGYLFFALRRVFGETGWKTFHKLTTLTTGYGLLLGLTVAVIEIFGAAPAH